MEAGLDSIRPEIESSNAAAPVSVEVNEPAVEIVPTTTKVKPRINQVSTVAEPSTLPEIVDDNTTSAI